MVRDLMNHSRETGIPVGPGRGSSAGSLVAWCIGITNVDPIRHGLLFERFINPERLDLPDADLDFSQARRHEVIEYLNARYGEEYVAGIPNFTYLGAASALRDTARIYGVDAADMAVSRSLRPRRMTVCLCRSCASSWPAWTNTPPNIRTHLRRRASCKT